MAGVRQASELRRLALYFDVGTEIWQTEADWRDLQPSQWDELFIPSISAATEGQEGPAHTYVLKPLDGRTTYLRRGPKARETDAQAVQQADVGLDAVSLHVSSEWTKCYFCRRNSATCCSLAILTVGLSFEHVCVLHPACIQLTCNHVTCKYPPLHDEA